MASVKSYDGDASAVELRREQAALAKSRVQVFDAATQAALKWFTVM